MTAVQNGRRRGGPIATVSTEAVWTVETIPIAGLALRLGRAGAGPPALVLPHDIGAPHQRPFHDALASHSTFAVKQTTRRVLGQLLRHTCSGAAGHPQRRSREGSARDPSGPGRILDAHGDGRAGDE